MTFMSITLVAVAVVLDPLDDVSSHDSVPHEIDASLMHFPKQVLSFLIHIRHRAQIDLEVFRIKSGLDGVPGLFQLVDPGPSQLPFDLEHCRFGTVAKGNFHHRLSLLSPSSGFHFATNSFNAFLLGWCPAAALKESI
jgi:hypothetical protein